MERKLALTLQGMRVLLFSTLLFVSFTASLYLSHQSAWWRLSMFALMAFSPWAFVQSYRRRFARKREANI
jgi:hypothetical protein